MDRERIKEALIKISVDAIVGCDKDNQSGNYFYEIRTRFVKAHPYNKAHVSDSIYPSREEALEAGRDYLDSIKKKSLRGQVETLREAFKLLRKVRRT